MLDIIMGLFKPVTEIVKKRQDRKIAREAAEAKLRMAKQEDAQEVQLNKDEYEQIATSSLGQTWKDEYVTVSVVSILNILVVGGIAAAFGEPRVLEGVGLAVQALTQAGVDIGFILEATIMAAIGLSIWKKV